MPLQIASRTHPRGSSARVQLAALGVAVAVGCLLGLGLLGADRASWHSAHQAVATVVGRSDKGVVATVPGQPPVLLHLTAVPPTGRLVRVEISPDGRARPLSYRQTAGRALRSGVLLSSGLLLLVQIYRFAVTRRPADPAGD